jgi:hypothetical protein
MKYLLFNDPDKDYGVDLTVTTVGVLRKGFGEFSVGVAEKLLQDSSVVEITTEQFFSLKKKLTQGAVSFQRPIPVHQDATKNPHAQYAGEEVEPQPEPDVIEVDVVEIDNPLEDKPKPKGKGRKRK